jgi:hypothetical protein
VSSERNTYVSYLALLHYLLLQKCVFLVVGMLQWQSWT